MMTERLIHIHVPRTGGTTLRHLIQSVPNINVVADPAHWPYRKMVQSFPVGVEIPPAIAFIRNPWDWYASLWRWNRNIAYLGFTGSFEDFMEIVYRECFGDWNFGTLTNACKYLEFDQAQHVGRFEFLRDDIVRIFQIIIPDLVDEQWVRRQIARLGAVKKSEFPNGIELKSYKEYYTGWMRNMVAEWDRELIEKFGYEF